jgi:hypothetical protein
MMEDIKTSIAKELDKAGINDKAAKIFLTRNPKGDHPRSSLQDQGALPLPRQDL